MKKKLAIVRNNIIILVSAPIIGLLLLLLVHLLPTETMRQNVYWSMDMISAEFRNELVVDGYRSTLTGNFTDCLMLEYAVYSNNEHSVWEQILHMYRSETNNIENDPNGWEPGRSLKDYLEGVPQPCEVEYGRYWHGYLIVLKPLLMFTSFNTLRLLNAALQLIGIGFVIMGFTRKKAEPLATAFLFSLPFMFFISTFASLSLSICLYLLIFALLAQLKCDNVLYEHKIYYLFFLITGIATAYFDFLTYPLITLAFPLCVYLYFHGEDFKNRVIKSLAFCMEWSIGYLGMWSSKWILCDLFTDSSTIKDAIATILLRTQSADGTSNGLIEVLKMNLSPFMNRSYLLLIVIAIILGVIFFFKNGIKNSLKNVKGALLYFVIALSPFLWYLATQNHSLQHWPYTCRIVSVTVFAGILAMYHISGSSTRNSKQSNK